MAESDMIVKIAIGSPENKSMTGTKNNKKPESAEQVRRVVKLCACFSHPQSSKKSCKDAIRKRADRKIYDNKLKTQIKTSVV